MPTYDNGFDDSTTVMHPNMKPTYTDVLSLPDHSEVLVAWMDGTVDAYDVEESFRKNMRAMLANSGESESDRCRLIRFIVVVTPEKMSDHIRLALMARGFADDEG